MWDEKLIGYTVAPGCEPLRRSLLQRYSTSFCIKRMLQFSFVFDLLSVEIKSPFKHTLELANQSAICMIYNCMLNHTVC